jgi:hypothetical protein
MRTITSEVRLKEIEKSSVTYNSPNKTCNLT